VIELSIDERGELAIENIEALMRAFPQYADRAIASGLKSEGYRLKSLIQAAIRAGGPDGERWEKLNPHTGILSKAKRGTVKNWKMVWRGKKGSKRRVRQYKEVMTSAKSKPMLRLAQAVRYDYDKDVQVVSIGFVRGRGVSSKLLRLAKLHAEGYETRITPRMRKMMFALGFPVKKSTTRLATPARPVIEPVFREEKDNIMRNVEAKFMAAINRYTGG